MKQDQIWHEGNLKDTVLRDVCYDGNTLTVCGDNGLIANSLNQGVNFARSVSGLEAPDHVFSVCCDGKGTVVAGSRFSGIAASTDYGMNWTIRRQPVRKENSDTIKKIAYGNGMFVGIKDTGGLVISKNLGKTWADTAPMIKSPDCIAFIKGLFYIGGSDDKIWRGDGNGTWEACQWEKSQITFRGCRAIGYSEALGLYFCAGHEVAISTNGKGWRTIYDLHATPAGNRNIHSMVEAGDNMLFGGEDCLTLLYDGKNFQQLGPLSNGAILSMVIIDDVNSGGDVIIGVGPAGVRHLHLDDIPDSTTPPKPEPPEPPQPPQPGGDLETRVNYEIDLIQSSLRMIKELVAGK